MRKAISIALASLLALSACDKIRNATEAADQVTATSLVDDIAGVWRTEEGEMITFQPEQGRLNMTVDQTFISPTLAEVDTRNETVSLSVPKDGKSEVWTIRRDWNAEKTQFTLVLTLHDGTQSGLAFVRELTRPDKHRIASLMANTKPTGSTLAAALEASEPSEAVQPVETEAASEQTRQESTPDEALEEGPQEASRVSMADVNRDEFVTECRKRAQENQSNSTIHAAFDVPRCGCIFEKLSETGTASAEGYQSASLECAAAITNSIADEETISRWSE